MVITGYTIYNIRHRFRGTWNSLTLLPKVPGVIICYGFSHPSPFKMGLVVMGPAYEIVVLGTSLSHNLSHDSLPWAACIDPYCMPLQRLFLVWGYDVIKVRLQTIQQRRAYMHLTSEHYHKELLKYNKSYGDFHVSFHSTSSFLFSQCRIWLEQLVRWSCSGIKRVLALAMAAGVLNVGIHSYYLRPSKNWNRSEETPQFKWDLHEK